jgi:hypothetical protein
MSVQWLHKTYNHLSMALFSNLFQVIFLSIQNIHQISSIPRQKIILARHCLPIYLLIVCLFKIPINIQYSKTELSYYELLLAIFFHFHTL